MIKNILYITIALLFTSLIVKAEGTPVTIAKGKYTSTKQTTRLKTFAVSKGDVIEIKLTTLHKRRGLNIWIKQHPGNLVVLDFEELKTNTKQIVAPADAIYQIFYGGTKLDFEIEVTNYTTKPNGPGRGNPVYVRIPDTLHRSGNVTIPVGENYTLTPYKEKVILKTSKQSEQICSQNFFTGSDLLEFDIPGTIKDEYREQKLLSYTVTLTCGEIGMQQALMGVVDAGIDAFVKIPGPKSKNKGKVKKGDSKNQYEFTNNLDEKTDKVEMINEAVGIAQEGADTLAPQSSTAKVLDDVAFVLDGGVKEVMMDKALDAAGAPKEMKAIIGTVESFPSVSDLAKQGMHKITPSIKGSAHLIVQSVIDETENIAEIPLKEFWIQSAMNYGKNNGGYWDVPGGPTSGKSNMDIQCWDIDNGIDRKFKMVPVVNKPKGEYHISSAMGGISIDNRGGNKNLRNNGNDIHLWETHGGYSQFFKFAHLGNGKFKIFNAKGHAICLDGRSNSNGTNIHIWEDHNGPWMEWYLIDPVTKQKYVPTNTTPRKISKKYTVTNKKGGFIQSVVTVKSNKPVEKTFIKIKKNGAEATAKLLIEAQYEITDYTDVIKYKRETNKVVTTDFWTAYKVNYDYQIMFKDQVQEDWQIIPKGEFYSSARPKSEQVKSDDYTQKARLARYNLLTKKN